MLHHTSQQPGPSTLSMQRLPDITFPRFSLCTNACPPKPCRLIDPTRAELLADFLLSTVNKDDLVAALTSRVSIEGLVRWAQTELHAPEDTAALVAAAHEADAAQRAALEGPPPARDGSIALPEEAGAFVPTPVPAAASGAAAVAPAGSAAAAAAAVPAGTVAAVAAAAAAGRPTAPAAGATATATPAAASAAAAAPAPAATTSQTAGAMLLGLLRGSGSGSRTGSSVDGASGSTGGSAAQAPLPGLLRGSSTGSGSSRTDSRTGSNGGGGGVGSRSQLRLGAFGSGVLRPLEKPKVKRSVKFAGAGGDDSGAADSGARAGTATPGSEAEGTPSPAAGSAAAPTAAAAATPSAAAASAAAAPAAVPPVRLSPELEAVLRAGSADPAIVARAAAEGARIASSASAPGAAARGLCTVLWDVGSCHLGTQGWESEDGHDHADDGTADLNGMLTSLKQQLITMGKYDARDRFEMAAFHDSRYFYQAADDEERAQALSARRVDELCRNLVSVIDVGADADAGGNKMRARLTNVQQNITSYGLRVATVVVITGDASFEGGCSRCCGRAAMPLLAALLHLACAYCVLCALIHRAFPLPHVLLPGAADIRRMLTTRRADGRPVDLVLIHPASMPIALGELNSAPNFHALSFEEWRKANSTQRRHAAYGFEDAKDRHYRSRSTSRAPGPPRRGLSVGADGSVQASAAARAPVARPADNEYDADDTDAREEA